MLSFISSTSLHARRIARGLTLVVCAALPMIASAHTYNLTLGGEAGATHYVGVVCSEDGGVDTYQLLAKLQTETVDGPLVSLQTIKGDVATSVTDTVNGDALPSASSSNPGGNGLYQVLINKTGIGAVTFNLTIHCLDKTGLIHTGTDAVVYQFQP